MAGIKSLVDLNIDGNLTVEGDGDSYINGGNFGIGTTAPFRKFSVVGNSNMEGALFIETSNNHIRLTDSDDASAYFSVGVNSEFQIRDVLSATTPVKIKVGAPDNSLVIGSNGSIGIGVSNLIEKLQVDGNVAATSFKPTGGSVTDFLKGDGSLDSNTYLTSTDISNVAYTNVSNTFTELQKISRGVAGTVLQINESDSNTAGLQLRSYANRADMYLYSSGIKTGEITGTNDSFLPKLALGSGAGSTGDTLEVTGDSSFIGDIQMDSNPFIKWTGNTLSLKATESTAIPVVQIRATNYGSRLQLEDETGAVSIRLRGDGHSYINGDNVGIGTTSPQRKLEVVSSSGIVGVLTSTGGGSYISMEDSATSSDSKVRYGAIGDNAALWAGGSQRITIQSDGKVGIGTTAPGYQLDVTGRAQNDDIGIRIRNTFDDNNSASEPNAALFLTAASNNGYLRVHGAPANTAAKHQIDLGSTAGSSFLTFSPSSTERMRITNNGNVGIGTIVPATELDVNGVITATGGDSDDWNAKMDGTGLINVSLGTANQDATADAYRSGKTGFGLETNPEEDIDLIGSAKAEYTYGNGAISRVQLGGENIASEVGYPSGGIKGQFITMIPRPGTQEDTDGMVSTFLQSDLSGIGQNNLLSQFGIQRNDNTRYANLISRKNNTNDGYQLGMQFFNNSNDARGWVRVNEVGEGVGYDQEPSIVSNIDMGASGDYSRITSTPHMHKMEVSVLNLDRYKNGSRVEGFTNSDTSAKTGTSETVLGEAIHSLNIDSDGNVVTKPIIEKTIKVTITPSQIRAASQYINGLSNPSITPVILVPDPVDGSAVVATEVLCKHTPTSDMYDDNGGSGYIMPNKDVALLLDHADNYYQLRLKDSFMSAAYGDEALGNAKYEIAHSQDKERYASGEGYNVFEEGKGIIFLYGGDYYDAYPGVSMELMITYKTIKF